ncbi:carboxypeptidase regulatory-like domain-containing protein [Acidobacteriota bacterium]
MKKKGERIKNIKTLFLLLMLLLVVPITTAGQAKNSYVSTQAENTVGVIKGKILDYETQKPLAGISVSVLDTDLNALSDTDGIYTIPEVPVGYYVLSFQYEGYYTDTRTDVIVRSGRTTFLNIDLLTVRMISEEVSVTADYFSKTRENPGSRIQINAEELRRDAGSASDVSRALYNVPGIIKVDEESNDLVVRGGSPAENGFYIDNIFIPNINHFPQWGASGGNISMLNLDFIENIQVYTGGFDASYGNRLSSIIDIDYREGDRERFAGQLNLSMLGYGGQIEGPFPNQKGSWMLSANKSYLEILRKITGGDGHSGYQDIQGKLFYDINDNNSLSLLTILGSSQTTDKREEMKQEGYIDYDREKFNTLTSGLNWRHLWGGSGYSDTSMSYSFMDGREDEWRVSDNELLYSSSYRNRWLTFRNVNNFNISKSHQIKFGFEAQNIHFRSAESYDDNEEKSLNGTFASAFLTYVVYPFHNFSLSSGLRLNYVPFSNRFHFSPRLSFTWMLNKRLSLNGAYGLYYQQMPLFLLRLHPENRSLQEMRARHLILGFTYLLRNDTQITLEAYDKQYVNFPMKGEAPYFFVIDDLSGDDAKFGNWGQLVDKGKAYARGIELTIQKKLAKKLYGLVSLIYYRAKYRDLMGVWHNRLYDNRLIFCLSGGFKPNKYWEFNARWTWGGNRAFTPVNEEKSIQFGYPWVDLKDIMSGHLNDYKNLSVRIDRRFYFKKTNLVLFAGAINLFGFENELYRYWVVGGKHLYIGIHVEHYSLCRFRI